MIAALPACLLGAGATTFAAGSARPRDVSLKPLGLMLLGAALVLTASPALADQYRQAADNAEVSCVVSARELTRISLIGDAFASVSKITTGYPYNDFTVTNEAVRGDIYLSVPEGFAPGRLSFFATTRKGFVYKFACTVSGSEAEQVFITNPALAQPPEPSIATATPQDAAVVLIQAMATGGVPNGYQVRQTATAPLRVGDLSVRMMSQYRGGGLLGKVLRVENRGDKKATLDPKLIAPSDALAISLGAFELAPRAATTLYVVQTDGAGA